MPQIIDVPGMGQVEFPDGMSDQDITSAIQKNIGKPQPQASLIDTIAGLPITRLAMGAASPLIGAAQLGAHVGDAANRAMGVDPVVSPWIDNKLSEYESAKQRGMKAAGNEGFDWMGLFGSLGSGAGTAKGVTAAIPAATGALGKIATGGAIGAATSAAQPVTNSPDFWNDKANQALLGGAMGAAATAVGAGVKAVRGGAPQLTPTQADTLRLGQKEGYVLQPSTVNPSFITNQLESIAGKASVGQEVSKRNNLISDAIAKREIGIPKNVPLTEDTLRAAREKAGKVYEEVDKLRPPQGMDWFPRFHDTDLLDQLKKTREAASDAFKRANMGDTAARQTAENLLAKADSIHGDISSIAKANGREDLVNALAEARVRIAKIHDVERALNLGDEHVSAPMIGRMLDKTGLGAKTGGLATVGRMAEAFPSAMRESAKVPASGVDGTNAAASAILGTMGYGAGGPAGLLASGLPLLRGPARNLVLSPAYQKFATSDPAKFQAIVDALAQQGSAATGTAVGRAN